MHWSTFARPEFLAPLFFLIGYQLRTELSHVKELALPAFAALGGMLLPAVLFIFLEPNHRSGWPIVMPTDVLLVMAGAVALGNRVSRELKTFLLALAIADDLFTLIVMAAKYSTAIRVSELSATMGAVVAGALLPQFRWEVHLTSFVNFVLIPIYIVASFAPLESAPSSTWSSRLALSIASARSLGKPLGIALFSWLALHSPRFFGRSSLSLREFATGGALAGMGLAVSLVISEFTFPESSLLAQTKSGLVIALPISLLFAFLISSVGRSRQK